jgi:hypothetical protein
MAAGERDLTAAFGRHPMAPLFDPSKLLMTPDQYAQLYRARTTGGYQTYPDPVTRGGGGGGDYFGPDSTTKPPPSPLPPLPRFPPDVQPWDPGYGLGPPPTTPDDSGTLYPWPEDVFGPPISIPPDDSGNWYDTWTGQGAPTDTGWTDAWGGGEDPYYGLGADWNYGG